MHDPFMFIIKIEHDPGYTQLYNPFYFLIMNLLSFPSCVGSKVRTRSVHTTESKVCKIPNNTESYKTNIILHYLKRG